MSASDAGESEDSTGRWRPPRAELISAASALGLLVVMFGSEWFGVAGVPGRSQASPAISTAANAWDTLTVLRWLMLATIAVALVSPVLHLTQRRHGTQTDTSVVVTLLGAATAASVGFRVLVSLPMPTEVVDQKLGAVLGVFCALGIALGGFESLREERARVRRLVRSSRRAGRVADAHRAR
jgi:hypothetical protein